MRSGICNYFNRGRILTLCVGFTLNLLIEFFVVRTGMKIARCFRFSIIYFYVLIIDVNNNYGSVPPALTLTQPHPWIGMSRSTVHAATPNPDEKPESDAISCPDCGRIFTGRHRAPIYKRHYRTVHLKIQLYSCDLCHRKFAHDNSRKRHSKICRLKISDAANAKR